MKINYIYAFSSRYSFAKKKVWTSGELHCATRVSSAPLNPHSQRNDLPKQTLNHWARKSLLLRFIHPALCSWSMWHTVWTPGIMNSLDICGQHMVLLG